MLPLSLSVVALAGLMWGTALGSTTYECSAVEPLDDIKYISESTVNIKQGCHYKSDDKSVYLFTPNMTEDAHKTTTGSASEKVVITIDQAVFEGTHLFVGTRIFTYPGDKISDELMRSTPIEFKMTNSKLFGIDELINFIGAFPYRSNITLEGNTMQNLGEGTIFSITGLNLTHESTFTFKDNTVILPYRGTHDDIHVVGTPAVLIVEEESKFIIEKTTFNVTRQGAPDNKAIMSLFYFGSENRITSGSVLAIRDNTFKLTNKVADEKATLLDQRSSSISSTSRIELSGNTFTTSKVTIEHFWRIRQFESQNTNIECPLQLTVTGNKLDGKELSVAEVNATFNPVEIGTMCAKEQTTGNTTDSTNDDDKGGDDPNGVLHPSVLFALSLAALVLLGM